MAYQWSFMLAVAIAPAYVCAATPQSHGVASFASLDTQNKNPSKLVTDFERLVLAHRGSTTKNLRGPPALDEFMPGCLQFSKALVYQNGGSPDKVAEQMHVICSGVQYAPDVKVCDAYLESLLGHLHDDTYWNLNSMDYQLYCEGMHKVETELAR